LQLFVCNSSVLFCSAGAVMIDEFTAADDDEVAATSKQLATRLHQTRMQSTVEQRCLFQESQRN